jgi:hypothetical protein
MRKFSVAMMAVGVLCVPGCDDGGAGPSKEERTLTTCAFEKFSVELTAGPSAPLMLEGTLYLAPTPADERTLRGMFEVGDKQYAVSSSYAEGGEISVSVAVDGGFVVGLGHVDKLCESGATIEGVAVGPTVAAGNAIDGTDVGHWLLNGGTQYTLDYYYDYNLGDPSTSYSIIKIPVTEVCTQNIATKATCYENFCQAQKAGHYSADSSGPICS